MIESLTDRARIVMAEANEVARQFKHEFVGGEHILFALTQTDDGAAIRIMGVLGSDALTVRSCLEKFVKSGSKPVGPKKLPLTPRAKQALERAIEEARERNDQYVGTGHILMGLLNDPDGVAGMVLNRVGITAYRAQSAFDAARAHADSVECILTEPFVLPQQLAYVVSSADASLAYLANESGNRLSSFMRAELAVEIVNRYNARRS